MTFTTDEIMEGIREIYAEWCNFKARKERCTSIRLPDFEKVLSELEAHLLATVKHEAAIQPTGEERVELVESALANAQAFVEGEVKRAEKLAEKWKAEGDMCGWNFHTGYAAGLNAANIALAGTERHYLNERLKRSQEVIQVARDALKAAFYDRQSRDQVWQALQLTHAALETTRPMVSEGIV